MGLLGMWKWMGAFALRACLLFPLPGAAADSWAVKSAGEANGKLQIVLRDGRVFALPLSAGQCSFDNVQVASDGMTVGWVEGGTSQLPGTANCEPGAQYVADGPVVWRGGRVIRVFDVWGGEINWSFYGNGDRIAFHAGPTHFDEAQGCELYDVTSGKLLSKWSHEDKTAPPGWAKNIIDY
jgi:hypothetical protein